MNIIQSLVKNLAKNHPNSTGIGIDFSRMSVEDAIQMMFMLISQDAKRDLRDMLEDMDATRRKKSALREAAKIGKNERSGEIKDLGANPAFANAVKDINADIDKLKKSEAVHRRTAEADRTEAEANLAAAKDLESRAGGLEQPVETDNKKNRKRVPLILSAVIGLIVIGAVFVKYEMVVPPLTPTVTPTSAPAGPGVGTLMLWVDGSTLIYYKGVWIYRSEVTNYQFSLCIEAGNCKPPTAGNPPSPDINDPEQANSPAQIIGPEAKLEYCSWAGGRVPTDRETTAFEAYQADQPVSDFPLSTENNAPTPEPTAGSRHVEAQDDNFEQAPGFRVDINSQTGKVTPTIDPLVGVNNLPLVETASGFRCVIEAPHPIAPACQTSAFYLNGAPAGIDHSVEQAGQFCQKGVGYVTLDINIQEGGSIQSVNEDCEVVGDNRVLCTSQSGVISDGKAIILGGLLPAVERQGFPVAGQMQCLPGYEANSDFPSQCSFNKLLPAVQNNSGFVTANLQRNDDQSSGQVSLVAYQPNSMPSTYLDLTCPTPLSFSERLGRCVFDIPAEDLARAGRNTDALPIWNPLTGYPPPNADGTCPEGSALYNGLYCIPNEDDGGPYGFGNPARPWNPLRGYPPANADGTCPEGTTLLYSHCIPGEPLPSEEDGGPLDFELRQPPWNPLAGYPPANADGTCPEGSTNFYGFCIPDEPAPGEEEDGAGWGFGWDPITGYPPRNADGTCPEGTTLFLDLYCLPNEAARGEGGTGLPSFGINWDPLGGFPLPDGYGDCPEGSALINGRCLPSEPPPSGSESLTGSGIWNPLAGYSSANVNGICPDGSTSINGHCIPNEPVPSDDPRCMPGYWFDETLGVCLPDIIFGCPVGTYFDKYERICIASGVPTSLTLPGFHFDEGAQCSLTDLPSGRYPGCPDGQAFDPSTGRCDLENIYVEDGKVLSTVEFNFSAPFCEVNNSSGSDGDDSGGCTLSDAACSPIKFDPVKCICY